MNDPWGFGVWAFTVLGYVLVWVFVVLAIVGALIIIFAILVGFYRAVKAWFPMPKPRQGHMDDPRI